MTPQIHVLDMIVEQVKMGPASWTRPYLRRPLLGQSENAILFQCDINNIGLYSKVNNRKIL